MNELQRFQEIKDKINELSNSKIRFEERFKTEKENLEKLIALINSKGYDPKKLSEIKDIKEKELKEALDELEKNMSEISTKLNSLEVSNV